MKTLKTIFIILLILLCTFSLFNAVLFTFLSIDNFSYLRMNTALISFAIYAVCGYFANLISKSFDDEN